jgi:hypothetical protein
MPRLNISPASMTKAVSGVDRMINRIPRRSQQSIKSIFGLIIFAGVIAGGVVGFQRGRNAAEIKSAPLINYTNDAFEVDVKREREGGNFSTMLDSEVINEMKRIDAEKMRFPTKTNLEPEADRGIVEPESGRKAKESPEIKEAEPLFEGDYRSKGGPAADVRSIERKGATPATEPNTVIEKEKSGLEPLPERETVKKPDANFRRDTDVRQLEKRKPVRGTDIRDPEPVDREGGIIKD